MPNTYFDSDLTGAQIEAALAAIHGVVSPSNNGKVLAIENGSIVAKSASEWTDAPVLEPLSVTANGDYTPGAGVDGYNSVHVAVSGAGTIEPLSVTQNGTYNPPSGVDGYAPVTVNVSGGGGATILSGTDAPSDDAGSDGNVYLKCWSTPSGFTALEYLESAGNQSIDTGVEITSDSYFEVKAAFTQNSNNNNVYGLGYANRESNVLVASGAIYNQIGSSNVIVSYDTNDHIFKATASAVMIDSTTGTPNWGGVPTGQHIRLFATAYDGSFSSGRISYAKIYYAKIYSGTTLIRDFIPVMRDSDSVYGMYDLINGVFYTNSGSGSFTSGGTVTPDGTILEAYVKVNGAWTPLIGANISDVTT